MVMDTPPLLIFLSMGVVLVTGLFMKDYQPFPDGGLLLNDIQGLFLQTRFTREVEHVTGFACCARSKKITFTEEEMEFINKCRSEVDAGEKNDSGHPNYHCVSQCYGEKKGLVDRDGFVVEEEFLEAVQDLYYEKSMKKMIKSLMPECVTNVNNKAKGMMAQDPEKYTCNPAISLANICMALEIQLKCPAAERHESERCKKFRQTIKNVKHQFLP